MMAIFFPWRDKGTFVVDREKILLGMLAMPEKQRIRGILVRRLYAHRVGRDYNETFNPVDECLFATWQGSIPAYDRPQLERSFA
jgi:hypothetical protein